MKLIKFYTNVINSIGLKVDDEGYIKVPGEKKDRPIMHNKKFLVMPVKNQIDTMFGEVDGKRVLTKVLFNPLSEDPVNGESASLIKLKSIVDVTLNFSYATIIELLLKLGSNLDYQKKATLNLNMFISTLNKAKGQSKTDAVDEKSIEKWAKIYSGVLSAPPSKGLLHVFLKKGGMINGVKYNRTCTLNLPVYKELKKLTKDTPLFGTRLRKKDIEVYKLVYEYVFKDLFEDENYVVMSNNKLAAGFDSLLRMYITLSVRFNSLLKELMFIDEESAKAAMVDLQVSLTDMDNIDSLEGEVAAIPSDTDAHRAANVVTTAVEQVHAANVPSTTIVDKRSAVDMILNNDVSGRNTMMQPTQAIQPQTTTVDTTGMTAAQKILYGNSPQTMQQQYATQTPQQQQFIQQVPPQYGQQMQTQYAMPQERPRGINSMVR